jgi:hypothetical protein
MTCDIQLTGIGLLSPRGGKESFFRAWGEGAGTPCPNAGNAALPAGGLTELLGINSPKLQIARYLDPLAKNAIVALEEAMGDAGIAPEAVAQDPYGFGILVAATCGPGATRAKAYEQLRARQGKLLSSTLFSNFGYNVAAATAAMAHGIKGPNLTVAGRSNLSLLLLRRARQLLATGRCHTVFTGFSESLVNGKGARRVPEWSCVFCLERAERARQRGTGAGVVLTEIELESSELAQPRNCAPAFRLPRAIPRPLSLAVLAGAETIDLDLGDPLGIGPEYLPLLQAGRIKATERLREETGYIAFPVSTRHGLSLLGVARA